MVKMHQAFSLAKQKITIFILLCKIAAAITFHMVPPSLSLYLSCSCSPKVCISPYHMYTWIFHAAISRIIFTFAHSNLYCAHECACLCVCALSYLVLQLILYRVNYGENCWKSMRPFYTDTHAHMQRAYADMAWKCNGLLWSIYSWIERKTP